MSDDLLALSLDVPDAAEWRHEVGYSATLAAPLYQAYQYLKTAQFDPDAYFRAYAVMRSYRDYSMSIRQRMHVSYVMAQAYAGEDALSEAREALEAAAEMAQLLRASGDFARVRYLAGAILHQMIHLEAARDAYRQALTAVRSMGPVGVRRDPDFAINLLSRIAGLECDLANFDSADKHLQQAHMALALWTPQDHVQLALLTWLDAIVAHWSGHPDVALPLAQDAAAILTTTEDLRSSGRVHCLVGEIALDMAETFPYPQPSQLRTALARRARSYAHRAVEDARQAEDPPGAALAQLLMQRCRRVLGRTERGIAEAERIIAQARRLQDPPLLGRAQVALGDELWAQGNREAARIQYYGAQRYFEEFDLRALSMWPNRALLRPEILDR
jgi:tetratricopeptide (TPR) repeat protein